MLAEIRIEFWNLVEERVTVVGESVVDLVAHRELRQSQDRRLPQSEHLAIECGVEFGGFMGGERDAVTPDQQTCDLAFGIQDALALHLCRVCRQYRDDEGVVEP